METEIFYPDPPHVSASFYLDRLGPEEALGAVCERAIDAGAVSTGHLQLVRTEDLPPFAMISDLASQVETVHRWGSGASGHLEWKRWLHANDSQQHVVRAGFQVPQVGCVVVAYEPIPDDADDDITHPIAVTTSGALLSLPAHVMLNAQEQQRAKAVARYLISVFRLVCESLDPLYGAITVEDVLPTPDALAKGNERLGTELFVSDRLTEINPELEDDLRRIFTDGFAERWATGAFFSGWAVFNPAGRTVEKPLTVGTKAARRMGDVWTMYEGGGQTPSETEK